MAKRKTTAIFFEDLKEDAQKRIIAHEMATILDCEPDEVEVENITVDDDMYGYDEDPKKQELLEHIHAETSEGNWLLVWDCMEREFQTEMKEG